MQVLQGFRPHALAVALASIYAMGGQGVLANPTGPQVANGQASFHTHGNTLTVVSTPGAIINWQSFSIRPGETTFFQQQNAASAVLNRVQAQNPGLKSTLDGHLGSNGRVFLINPNGIVFGAGSTIDTQGFVASTLALSDADFKAQRLRFQRQGAAGDIQVQGAIQSAAGDVYLVAPNIGVDGKAVITSDGGNIVLAAGEVVEITGRNLNDIKFAIQNRDNQVLNLGSLSAGAVGVFAGTLTHSGAVQAQSVAREGGRLVLSSAGQLTLGAGSTARADGATQGGSVQIRAQSGNLVVDAKARISAEATGPADTSAQGGTISLRADTGFVALERGSTVSVDGPQGGSVVVSGGKLIQDGSVTARGTAGTGGSVRMDLDTRVIQTAAASISATGTRLGGTVHVGAGTSAASAGHLYSSATIDADGGTGRGGHVVLTGRDVVLAAATVRADGDAGGGSVLVGGGRSGQDARVANAHSATTTADTSLQASARQDGKGGEIVVWADGTSRVGGALTARGGASGGDGGFIEASGKQATHFTASPNAGAPAGKAGTFLLDPKNIVIEATAVIPGVSVELLDPNPGGSEFFGSSLQVLNSQGTILVFNPQDDFAGTDSGAVYLFSGSTGSLISALRGSAAGDQVGSSGNFMTNVFGSTITLGNGDRLIRSPSWGGSAGALTPFNLSTGASGAVSSANSLVGASAGDQIGSSGIRTLNSGKLGVFSPNWSGTQGAITWYDSAAGMTGVVSAANSLVGSSAGDRVGDSGINQFSGTRWYVASADWNSAAGAVTLVDTASPLVGPITSANSLVGSLPNDRVGSDGIYDVYSNTYAVFSPEWNGGMGAVTWYDTVAGTTGVVSPANSLTGSHAGDRVGSGYWENLNNKLVIKSFNWTAGGTLTNAGAMTWVDPSAPLVGEVGAGNSLVGSHDNDSIGGGSLVYIDGIRYIARHPGWNSNSGAVTWVDTASPAMGAVSSTNSLVGGSPGDFVGSNGVFTGYGKAAVFSPDWNGSVGAVSWMDEAAGTVGVVGAANSLVGSTVGDRVGSDSLLNMGGRLGVFSPDWGNTASAPRAGAVTWVDGATGIFGAVSAANSLVGSSSNDRVGSNGLRYIDGIRYLLHSPNWNSVAGAITWVDSAAPVVGTVSSSNSLVGAAAGDQVGSGAMVNAVNGKTMVFSPNWGSSRGAVTWFDNATGTTGVVGATNSLVGSTPGDQVGGFGNYQFLGSSVAIRSPNWNNGGSVVDAGAVTWVDAAAGLAGAVDPTNSLVGSVANDRVGNNSIQELFSTGNYVLRTPDWNSNSGAVTWIDPAAPVVGAISSANSLIGGTVGDQVGGSGFSDLSTGHSLVFSPGWNGNRGAVTWYDNTVGTFGVVSASNSLVGSTAGTTTTGDRVGGNSYQNVGGQIAIRNPNWSNGGATKAGAITFADAPVTGVISLANSLVGTHANDRVGNTSLQFVGTDRYYLANPNWNSSAGAVTLVNTSGAPMTGAVSASNSLVGGNAGDQVGNSVQNLFNGKSVVTSTAWNAGRGAVTWFDNNTGTVGVVDATNSLVGSSAGDAVGSSGRSVIGSLVGIRSPNWDNGTIVDAGAITWGSLATGVTGVVSTANSLVGGNASDRVGTNVVESLDVGHAATRTTTWNGNMGAVTWINTAAPLTGVVSAANSLVGSAAGDQVGGNGFTSGNAYEVLRSNAWSGSRGAVTWINPAAPPTGAVSAVNSLVGANPGDSIGSGGVFILGTGDYYVPSPGYAAGAGAVSVGLAASGISGVVSGANSLVGQTAGDGYGNVVSEVFSGGSLLVRASNANSNGLTDNGRIHLYAGGAGGGAGPSGALGLQTFAINPSGDSVITPAQITAITNTGTSVVLQAHNDITLRAGSDIVTNNPGGNGGDLTLQAGRSIVLNSSITTDNGNLTVVANETVAHGVVAIHREAGMASISMADGTAIHAGTGNVDLQLASGSGHAGETLANGTVLLRSVTATNLAVMAPQGGIQIGAANAAVASNIVLSGDAILESATAVALLGGAPGAFAQLSADNSITVTSPTLTLVNGRSFARMLVPTQSTPITVSGLTTGYFPVSGFEFTGLDAAPATQELDQILAMNPVPVFVEVTTPLQAEKKEEPEIAVDAGETCQ
jgi:filamentous hemagglutinin family protein